MNDAPLALRVKDFTKLIGISQSSFWLHVKNGKIRVIKIVGRTLIPYDEVERIQREGVK